MAKIGVIGAGSWGTALALLLHTNGHQVSVWSIVESEIEMLKTTHEHRDKLPGVRLPEDMEFTKAGISGGAGRIYIESIKAKEMELSLGVGETSIDSLEVEKIKVSAGIGAVNLHLASPASEYKVKISKGIGDARFNGKVVGNDETFGDGAREVEVSGGIGSIDITTVEEKKTEE